MRRRLLFLLLGLTATACQQSASGDNPPGPDARWNLPPPACPPPGPTPSPLCTDFPVCGNNVVEQCWRELRGNNLCPYWLQLREVCDGNAMSCQNVGYVSGTTSCTTSCTNDLSNCSKCAEPNLGCFDHESFAARRGMALSGTHVAVIDWYEMAIVDGASAGPRPSISGLRAIVGVPGGWLVATESPPQLRFVDTDGNLASPRPIAHAMVGFGYGPGGRVLLAWNEGTQLALALVDATGAIVVPTFLAGEGGVWPPSVTTDGTHFFVAARGRLVRVAADGTHTAAEGFPRIGGGVPPLVTWGGTSGWFVQIAAEGYQIQRFDAAGAPVGETFTITPPGLIAGIVGIGDELELLLKNEVALVRVDTAGTASPPRIVGVGSPLYIARRDDGAIVLTFSSGDLYVEVLPP